MNPGLIQHQALQELTLLSHCNHASIAEIADVLLAVWHQYHDSAIELDDYHSILTRNRQELRLLPQSNHRDIAIKALEDLL